MKPETSNRPDSTSNIISAETQGLVLSGFPRSRKGFRITCPLLEFLSSSDIDDGKAQGQADE